MELSSKFLALKFKSLLEEGPSFEEAEVQGRGVGKRSEDEETVCAGGS